MGDRLLCYQSEQWGVFQPLHRYDTRAPFTERFQATEITPEKLDSILEVSGHDRLTWIGPGDREAL